MSSTKQNSSTASQDAREQLKEADSHIAKARVSLKNNNYGEAIEHCEEAVDLAKSAKEGSQSIGTNQNFDPQSRIDDAEDIKKDAINERDKFKSITQRLDRIEDRLDSAEQKHDLKNHQEALEQIATAEELIENKDIDPADHGFENVAEQLQEQQGRCTRLRDKIQSSQEDNTSEQSQQHQADTVSGQSPPKSIPDTPRTTLSYSDIDKGESLGKGGNADVYQATADSNYGEITLAIKEPRVNNATVDTNTIDQMLEEAETWQQLDTHDHIVSVLDYGSKPLPWIAMEYMEGGDLSQRTGQLAFRQALWTSLAITKGVRHAHKMGVAHLDLKPANILFRSVEGAWDVPKVADWGLSKHLLKHSQSIDGMSPRYAAPEQLDTDQFGQTDTVTDVYQLGTVLYELFTGQQHFEGQTYEVMNKIQSSTPTKPSDRADIPETIDDILMTALATEKEDRYDDVIYLRDALQDLWNNYK